MRLLFRCWWACAWVCVVVLVVVGGWILLAGWGGLSVALGYVAGGRIGVLGRWVGSVQFVLVWVWVYWL